jgi:TonB family protein
MRLRPLVIALLACTGRILGAQSAPDSAQCRVALTAASPDSQSTRIGILVDPLDTANHLGTPYRELIGQGIHQFLAVPNPMSLHVYDPGTALMHGGKRDSGVAVLTLRSAYRAMLHRDGHLTQIRAVSGTRDEGFDAAIVHAMEELSTSELLPPPSAPDVNFRGDSLDLRILVTPAAVSVFPQGMRSPLTAGVTPLLLLRLPIRHITQQVRVRANGRGPVYPEDLRRARVEGSTMFEFVVDTSGRVDLSSVAVLRSTAPQFIGAVVDALPNLRFDPMYVEGCAVPVLVQQPFDFSLRH